MDHILISEMMALAVNTPLLPGAERARKLSPLREEIA
jgi:hypothetical protein